MERKNGEARFIYTTHEVAEEDLEALNELRIRVMEPFSELTAVFHKKVLPYGNARQHSISLLCPYR